ncbi:MAG: hypothetical protein CSA49_04075 [Gammaproteobacteria bacterium]|nr:MAG: hypothetical protein CSA49_04075 [Gammaproteobacteria bacterium]
MKRALKRIALYLRNYPHINKYKNHVKNKLNADKVSLASIGGADINFLLFKSNKPFAMMRLAIVDHEENPFVIDRFSKSKRIQHETQVYKACGPDQLTPELLIAEDNFTVCRYIDGKSADQLLKNGDIDFYDFYSSVLDLYVKIHQKGFSHLDATLKNIFYDTETDTYKVVDFEYYAKPEFKLESQKVYDYLRLTEYCLRFYGEDVSRVLKILDQQALQSYNNIDLKICRPLLDRLNECSEIQSYLGRKNILL